ncbi:MAG: fluoride efflux transporter CrcB, partial [Spartobacteria bacterium]|nr:fluoride efflux transporter CrcB [Spartobacteria bacterium]
GSLARWFVYAVLANFRWAADFPYATLFVNVSGSFGIGLLAAILSDEGLLSAPPSIRTLILAGFFGGFTTFSAFSLQTLDLIRSNAWLEAWLNILLSITLGLAAVWLGSQTAHLLSSASGK